MMHRRFHVCLFGRRASGRCPTLQLWGRKSLGRPAGYEGPIEIA